MGSYITLEEHFLCPDISSPSIYSPQSPLVNGIHDKLHDIARLRLASMDKSGVQRQVLSHVPAHQKDWSIEECQTINNFLAQKCSAHPDRFVGFATLPMHDPSAAVLELERCITRLNFVGALVDNTTTDGTFYEGEAYWPLFAKLVELDVPIYLHPTWASPSANRALFTGEKISETASMLLGGPALGWHAGVAIHVLRLFAAGVFDQFPTLKVIIGHDGELLTFNLARTARLPAKVWGVERDLMQVWNENIWVTTSGMFTLGPLKCLLEVTKKDRIMLSVDYPFSENDLGEEFMEQVKKSGLLTEDEWKGMASENARKLLRL